MPSQPSLFRAAAEENLYELDHAPLPPTSWKETLADERAKPYFTEVLTFVENERLRGKEIFPSKENTFRALRETPLGEVKVVILGQDPYHGPGQAHGLCFSVLAGTPPPPSLRNIFKELRADIECASPRSGELTAWARQGVLLLNTVLTVERGKAHSHAHVGWERFTDKIVEVINLHRENVVFLLWGSHAKKKAEGVDSSRHCVLSAPHPSPLSAHRGFFGCRHFSRANEYLSQTGQQEVSWDLL